MKNKSDMWRLIIGVILGVIIVYGAISMSKVIVANKNKPKKKVEKQISKVFTQIVQNTSIPVVIQEKGNLQALKKVDLYSEVQGILKTGNRLFKPGQYYKSGSTIFSIDDREFKAGLTAQKSVLFNLVAQVMPELKLDYPNSFLKWQTYLNGFDIEKTTPKLPEFSSDREKFFINSKNIVTTYYNIKNLEERHKKYNIYAPFYGIVSESNVNPGALVRSGQKLGSILSPSLYELSVSVNESYQDFIKTGKKVNLFNLDHSKSWEGKISRIDATINTATQGVQLYIQVSGKDLKEGMFLEAEIEGKAIEQGFELSRKLLIENSKIFIVENEMLKLIPVDVAFFKDKAAIVTNLEDGAVILKNSLPGAYEGMLVEEVKESNR